MSVNKLPPRPVVYSNDIANIMGKTPRSARRLLQKIREAFGKPDKAVVTVKEFCEFSGIEEEIVNEFLQS